MAFLQHFPVNPASRVNWAQYIETTFTVVEIRPTVFTLLLRHQLNPLKALVNVGANTVTTLRIDTYWRQWT